MTQSNQSLSITQYHDLSPDPVDTLLTEHYPKDRANKRHDFLIGAFFALCVGMIGLQFIA